MSAEGEEGGLLVEERCDVPLAHGAQLCQAQGVAVLAPSHRLTTNVHPEPIRLFFSIMIILLLHVIVREVPLFWESSSEEQ
jgi:hypothetical protein